MLTILCRITSPYHTSAIFGVVISREVPKIRALLNETKKVKIKFGFFSSFILFVPQLHIPICNRLVGGPFRIVQF